MKASTKIANVVITLAMITAASAASASVASGTNQFGNECPGGDRLLGCAEALMTSAPTMTIGDSQVDQSSQEYKALAIDQAVRTLSGESTLLFGTDLNKAHAYLELQK